MKLETYFRRLGYDITEYENMKPHIHNWKSWYKGKIPDFQNYYIYNGDKKVLKTRKTIGIAKKICEDFADLLLNEKVVFNIGDKKESQVVNDILDQNDFYILANKAVEKTFWGGIGAFVLSIKDLIYDTNTNIIKADQDSKLKIEFVTADKIIPLSFEGEKITECAFVINKTINNKKCMYISIHRKNENGNYIIENHLFRLDKSDNIQEELIDNAIKEIDTKGNKAWFSVLRPNISNNLHEDSPFGMSVFANAIDIIKALDIVFDSLTNEFILGRKRIFVKSDMLKPDPKTGGLKLVFDENEIVFHSLPEDNNDRSQIVESDMKLRVTEHEQALQLILDILSSKVGLGDKYYEFRKTGIATATQVISENSDLFRTIRKHEIAIENCLYDLFRSILFIENTFFGANLKEDAEISINFDDSIIEDVAEIKKQALLELNAGLIDDIEYYKRVYKMTEEQAKKFKQELQKRASKESIVKEIEEE